MLTVFCAESLHDHHAIKTFVNCLGQITQRLLCRIKMPINTSLVSKIEGKEQRDNGDCQQAKWRINNDQPHACESNQ